MNTIRTHNLIGIDHLGHTCSCGHRSTHWEDHLYLLSLQALGEPEHLIQKTRDALAAERSGLTAQLRAEANRRKAAARPTRAQLRARAEQAA